VYSSPSSPSTSTGVYRRSKACLAEAGLAAEEKLGRPLTSEEKAEAAEKLRAVLDEVEDARTLDARIEHAADLLDGE
jgi:hypothetical protein